MNNKIDRVLSAVARPRGGVNVAHHKNTAELETERMPAPRSVVLSMKQCIGAACEPTVKPGDEVKVGQVVGDCDKPVSSPVHATVSGVVSAVGEITLAHGAPATAVTIESDGLMSLYEQIRPPEVSSTQQLLAAIRASGLVGLGGAGFPTHIKLSFGPDKQVDTLIVNVAECEPYITVDYRECIENAQNIIYGIEALKSFFPFKSVIIAVEDNKPKAIETLSRAAGSSSGIRIMRLKSRYPQGAEKMMVLSVTGRRVPPGALPADVGCVVMNVASVAFVGRYLKTGKPLVSRTITVDGTAIKSPKNLRVPIGTSLKDIIDYCGGFCAQPEKIIFGGPMMGVALCSVDAPILKQNNALLAFKSSSDIFKSQSDCIRCGRCVQACPMSLMPVEIERYAEKSDVKGLIDCSVNVCMECGCCAYVCPAGRPLVQYMRLAKQLVRGEENKK